MELQQLRFPIGEFNKPASIARAQLENYFSVIDGFPARIRKETEHLLDEQLDTPYRPGGWTIRQVVHHCADSHMNAFVRLKLTLTEDRPTVKPYFEDKWAELADGRTMPVSVSLNILDGLHKRWAFLLRSLAEDQFKRTFIHPEHGTIFSIAEHTALYAWHCEHHLAHITTLKKEKNWK